LSQATEKAADDTNWIESEAAEITRVLLSFLFQERIHDGTAFWT
jgi:hypothetical protein